MSRLDKCPECDCDEIDTSDDVWFCLGCGVNIGVLDDYIFKVGALESELRRLREREKILEAALEAAGDWLDKSTKEEFAQSIMSDAAVAREVFRVRRYALFEARDGEKST